MAESHPIEAVKNCRNGSGFSLPSGVWANHWEPRPHGSKHQAGFSLSSANSGQVSNQHVSDKACDHIDAVEDVSQRKCRLLKGRDGLARGSIGNLLLESLRRGKVHVDTEQIRKSLFNRDHIQQRQTTPVRELSDDVHIRRGGDGSPSPVGATSARCQRFSVRLGARAVWHL